MYKNNNNKITRELAKKHLFQNKFKLVISIIAIALTTLLITTVSTIGFSMQKTIENSAAKRFGSTAHSMIYVSKEEAEKVKQNKLVKEYGVTKVIGDIVDIQKKKLDRRKANLYYMDENSAKYNFILDSLEGSLPKEVNDIVIDDIVLNSFDKKPIIGDEITMKYESEGIIKEGTFKLSGIYKGSIVSDYSKLIISKKYIDKNVKDNLENFTLEIMLSNTFKMDEKVKKILLESGFEEDFSKYGINFAYKDFFNMNKSEVGSILLIILIIMLSGYLIIYNIFYISIIKETRFYGLIKTIGITSKQIKKIVLYEGLILSFIGIILGLFMGYIVGIIVYINILDTTNGTEFNLSTNPLMIAVAVIFSLITVLLGCYRPIKIASKVSPIEAIRYTGSTNKKYKSTSSTRGSKIWYMAFTNIVRSKRKVISVVVSLALSIILVNVVYTVVSTFRLDDFLSKNIGTDYTIGDVSYYSNDFNGDLKNVLTNDLCSEIQNMDGIKEFGKVYGIMASNKVSKEVQNKIFKGYKKAKEKGEITGDIKKTYFEKIFLNVYGIDEDIYKYLDEKFKSDKDFKKAFDSGNYIIIDKSYLIGQIYEIGDKIKIELSNKEIKEYEVLEVIEEAPYALSSGRYGIGSLSVYLPADEFEKFIKDPTIMTALFNVEDDKINYFDSFLEKKANENKSFDYRSLKLYQKEYYSMVNTIKVVGYSFSLIIGIIGVLNFINLICTNIISKKYELAVMQSIGMTRKQLKKMLSLEGFYHGIFTMIFIFTIGLPVSYYCMRFFKIPDTYISVLPIVSMLIILFVFSWILPRIVYKFIGEKNLVERIKINE
ncbi:MAG: FtsX-like permease family protein [Clostridiales bacterium]